MGVNIFRLLGALAVMAILIWVLALRAERDQAKAEAAELAGVVEVQGASIAALEQDKKAASAALAEWQAKNAQITRDLAAARKATVKAALADNSFNAWGAAALPDAVFAERLLQSQICSDPASAN